MNYIETKGSVGIFYFGWIQKMKKGVTTPAEQANTCYPVVHNGDLIYTRVCINGTNNSELTLPCWYDIKAMNSFECNAGDNCRSN
uniref:Uncharacterized protein n=1 Tax=Romanomermis culicivorax TaxID=13658 RepID=A0A915KTE1_ROMCU